MHRLLLKFSGLVGKSPLRKTVEKEKRYLSWIFKNVYGFNEEQDVCEHRESHEQKARNINCRRFIILGTWEGKTRDRDDEAKYGWKQLLKALAFQIKEKGIFNSQVMSLYQTILRRMEG